MLTEEEAKKQGIPYLPNEEYAKALFQLRAGVTTIFDFMKVDEKFPVRYLYGLGVYVDGAIDEIVRRAEDFSLRTRGMDKPLNVPLKKRRIKY